MILNNSIKITERKTQLNLMFLYFMIAIMIQLQKRRNNKIKINILLMIKMKNHRICQLKIIYAIRNQHFQMKEMELIYLMVMEIIIYTIKVMMM